MYEVITPLLWTALTADIQCVMGMQGEGQGCILADEMGLGKTIQAISLVWTLLSTSRLNTDDTAALTTPQSNPRTLEAARSSRARPSSVPLLYSR